MEQTLAWIAGHPDTTFLLAVIWIGMLLVIGYIHHTTRRLELRMRVLIDGHMAYYRELNPSEFALFVETESYKQYCYEEYLGKKK